MCPLPLESLPFDIGENSTDEEILQFLKGRKYEDPIPWNVITEVNPFSIDPRNSPEGIWFLYTSEALQSHNERGIIKVVNGYWRSMDTSRILTSTPTVGRKITRDFFVGEAPYGDKTGWRMQEYCAEQIVAEDSSALCRIFLQNDEGSDTGEQCGPVNPGDAAGEYIESAVLSLLKQEERNTSKDGGADGSQAEQKCSQVPGEEKLRQLESSSNPLQDSANDNTIKSMQAGYDFSKEDFLELKDLYDPMSSSSSSDNSSLMSMNSDECFDAEALLRDIENEGGLDIEEHVDYRLSVTTTVRSNHVVIQPSSHAFSNISNLVVSVNEITSSTPQMNPALASSTIDQQNDSDGSTSSSTDGKGSHDSGSQSGSTQQSSPRGPGSKFRIIGKLGKKYCCLGPF